MSETKALYDGDRLPEIAATYGTWISLVRGKEPEDLYARTLQDMDWLLADCARQRAENDQLRAILRADAADGSPALDGAIRDALHAWHDLHREWYAATNPHRTAAHLPRFDEVHTTMARAWGRLVKLLDAARGG